tara:strand:- start:3 stop:740 length:738 start_codon:yes stop_codon:yes gene_type:complete
MIENIKKMTKVGKGVNKVDLNSPVYLSFFLSMLALSGSTIFTVLGSLADYNKEQRYLKNALISETVVNVIATLTYVYFMQYLYENKIKLENITSIRYLDWVITTPLLLLSFALYSSYTTNKGRKAGTSFQDVDFTPLIYIIILNLFMLLFGFLGETNQINKHIGFTISVIFFIILFYFIYTDYVQDKDESLTPLFGVFTAVWFLYGVAYYLPVIKKNIAYNILDMISKSAFGIFLWFSTITDLDN